MDAANHPDSWSDQLKAIMILESVEPLVRVNTLDSHKKSHMDIREDVIGAELTKISY